MDNLLTVIQDHILTITLNRPEKLNALNRSVIGDLGEVISQAKANDEIKGIIITGAEDKAFAAGADISEFADYPPEEAKLMAQKGQEVLNRISHFPKPIIAAVNGFCLGGGFELALSCHIRIGEDHAKFGLPEVTLGLLPGYGGTQRFSELAGRAKALEFIITGELFDAQTALNLGVINHLVEKENSLSFALKLMQKIITKAPIAVAQIIKTINAFSDKEKNGYKQEIESFTECFETEDFKEGVNAFLEKRKAIFTGK